MSKRKASKDKRPDLMPRARAAVAMLNGGREDKPLELAAFMEIFHGRTLTRAEAESMLDRPRSPY